MGEPGKFYYFAYGANMNPEQIGMRCANPQVVAAAWLDDYRIGFFDYTKIWDGALETAIPDPDGRLWGVVYELNGADREKLDAWQDARMDGAGALLSLPGRGNGADGTRYRVLFYKKDQLGAPCPPSRQYLEFIVQGARARDLPEDYIERLNRIETREAAYPVPRFGNFNFATLGSSGCSACEG
jgi:hypothetical protein